MRKVFIFVLSLILGLSSICYAFADDDSGEVPASSPELSPEFTEFIFQASDEDDRQLRQAAAIMAATSYYDIDDIYSILSSVRTIDNSRYVWSTLDESTWSEVHNVYNKLITNSYNNTYYSISELVAQLLIQFNSFSSFFYSPLSGSASLWQLTDDIKTFVGLGLFDSNANSYLSLINSGLSSLNSTSISSYNKLHAIFTDVDSIDANVSDILNVGLPQVISASNNTTNSVNNVKSSVDSLRSDFNNISWSSNSSSFLGYSLNFSDTPIIPSSIYDSIALNTDFYLHYSNPNFVNVSIYRFDLNIWSTYSSYTNEPFSFIEVLTSDGSSIPGKYYFDFDFARGFACLYLYDFTFPRSSNIVIHFVSSHPIRIGNTSNGSFNISYLSFGSSDFYTVYQYLSNKNQIDILSNFAVLYASDDLISAKENQQSYEDQAITDFTGSGSAAAKGSDLTNLKSVSGTIQSGLQSGGSVSNALAPFNPSGGFWGWFSQSNSDDINNPSLLRRDDQFIDFYSDNQSLLQSLLGGSDR